MGKNREKHEEADVIFKEVCSGVYKVEKNTTSAYLLDYANPKEVALNLSAPRKVLVLDSKNLFIHANF